MGFPGHPAEHRGGAHIHMWSGRIGKLAFEAPPIKDSCLLLETSLRPERSISDEVQLATLVTFHLFEEYEVVCGTSSTRMLSSWVSLKGLIMGASMTLAPKVTWSVSQWSTPQVKHAHQEDPSLETLSIGSSFN